MENKKRISIKSVRNSTGSRIQTADRSKFLLPTENAPYRESTAPATPTKHVADSSALLTPFKVLKDDETPVDSLQIEGPSSSSLKRIPSSPAPAAPTPIQQFHQSLYRTFQDAGKPTPLLNQSEAALASLGDEWQAFLAWLPTAPQFQQTRNPGGIPTLIEFFREKPITKEAPELPAPCPKCRTLEGRVSVERIVTAGLRKGEAYRAVVECDCPLGQTLSAAYRRQKEETKKLAYRGFRDVAEMMPGDEDTE